MNEHPALSQLSVMIDIKLSFLDLWHPVQTNLSYANSRRFSLLPGLSLRHHNAQHTALHRHQGFLQCPELTERPEWWLQMPGARGWGLRLELHQTAMTPNSTMHLVCHSWKLLFYIFSFLLSSPWTTSESCVGNEILWGKGNSEEEKKYTLALLSPIVHYWTEQDGK